MIDSKTLEFLSELQDNNQRDWFNEHRKRYEAAKNDIAQVVTEVIAGISKFDEDLQDLEAKQSLFRIFKDVRFSKDKLPYKTNMGAWMAKGGRKSIFAGYYLHVEPGNKSFLAGGSYMPAGPVLKGIREAIDYEPADLRKLIAAKPFLKYFNGLEGEKLKTAPRDYPKDHEAIDLLRHKSFVVSTQLTDAEISSKDFFQNAMKVFEALNPLVQYLNKAIAETES